MMTRERHVDLWYPRLDGRENTNRIRVSLMDVRAADDLLVEYDFDRDGYRLLMATIHQWSTEDAVMDDGLVEVGFVPAWVEDGLPDG